MKFYSPLRFLILFSTFFVAWNLHAAESGWTQVPEILKRIVPPAFPDKEFKITDYGAVPDGKTLSSQAITKAIDACAASGGGHVVVPAGTFLTGPIHLKSTVDLQLAKDATLSFSTDPSLYLPLVPTRFEGMECMNYSPLIYAKDMTNVAVSGEGTLDGQADSSWLLWKGKKQASDRARLNAMVNQGVPLEKRVFGDGSFLRPNFIQFVGCRNVLIEGVKIRRSPMWEIHPILCTNVTVRGVDIECHGANNDGCDPESCTDVLIEKCLFDTGDDCIAIKSGRNNDGRRINVPSSNLIIRDCVMKDGHGGVSIGSEISGGCTNVFIEHCEMSSPELACALRLKSNAMRGGTMENIFMRDVRVGTVKKNFLTIDLLYEEGAKGAFMPVIRNVVVENVSAGKAPQVVNARSFPGATATGIRILNSKFGGVEKPDEIQNADVKVEGCEISKATLSSPQ
jgi:polygalacturonase